MLALLQHWSPWIEVASDVMGFASAVMLLIPTYSDLETKLLISESQEQLAEIPNPQLRAKLAAKFGALEAGIYRLTTKEANLVRWGLRSLVASFGLKLFYHFITKV